MDNNGKIGATWSRSFASVYLFATFDRSVSKSASRLESDTIFRENRVYCVLLSLSAPIIFMRDDSHDATRECLFFSWLRNAQYSPYFAISDNTFRKHSNIRHCINPIFVSDYVPIFTDSRRQVGSHLAGLNSHLRRLE